MGRVTVWSQQIQDNMVKAIEMGNYAHVAAEYAGISKSTHYNWLKLGEKGEEPYVEYLDAIKKAEAIAQVRNVGIIQEAAIKTWTAAAWFLERKHYNEWGRRERSHIELTGANGAPIEIAQVDARAALLAMLGHEVDAPLEQTELGNEPDTSIGEIEVTD
jgi:hypothetical protein